MSPYVVEEPRGAGKSIVLERTEMIKRQIEEANRILVAVRIQSLREYVIRKVD